MLVIWIDVTQFNFIPWVAAQARWLPRLRTLYVRTRAEQRLRRFVCTLCKRRSVSTAPWRVGGNGQRIESAASHAIVRSWLWPTVAGGRPLGYFGTLLQVVGNWPHKIVVVDSPLVGSRPKKSLHYVLNFMQSFHTECHEYALHVLFMVVNYEMLHVFCNSIMI